MSLHVGRSTAVALWGTQGTPIAIEASINSGLPGIDVVGLPDTSVNEAKKRVRASVANLGFAMSAQRITVNLSPASVKKYGTNFDLGIAVAILQAERRIPQATDRVVFCAELGLDSRLHPVNGVVPTLIAAKQAGLTTVVVSQANEKEARMLTGLNVFSANSLGEVVNHFGGDVQVPQLPPVERHATKAEKPLSVNDLSQVQGQDEARYALEVAAAGGHHILMIGSPGAGKTILAGCLPGLLPALSEEQAIESFSLRSIDGTLNPEHGLDTTPPFEAPHHSTTSAAMVGGSKPTSIGVFSRAHRGVLFMDESCNGKCTSFSKEVTDGNEHEHDGASSRPERAARTSYAVGGIPGVHPDWTGRAVAGNEADLPVLAAVEVPQGQGRCDRAAAA